MEVGENGKKSKSVQKHVEPMCSEICTENVTARLHRMMESPAMGQTTRLKIAISNPAPVGTICLNVVKSYTAHLSV